MATSALLVIFDWRSECSACMANVKEIQTVETCTDCGLPFVGMLNFSHTGVEHLRDDLPEVKLNQAGVWAR